MQPRLQGLERPGVALLRQQFAIQAEGRFRTARSRSTTSGKKRSSDLPDLASRETRSPALKARQRNPSHFGSNHQPAPWGRLRLDFASIGTAERIGLMRTPRASAG